MQFIELVQLYQDKLNLLYDEEEVQSLFLMAVKDTLGYNRSDYLLNKQQIVPDTALLRLNNILNELVLGKPIQYILGYAEFYGLKFNVNPSVLIPRPETEELVEWILTTCRKTSDEDYSKLNISLLDIGTGSGCIAIVLKKHLPKAQVSAIDISTAALTTAKQNALLNEVPVVFIEDDILNSQIEAKMLNLDVIVSNPPYIMEEEKTAMHQNVLANEPHTALFVANDRPLIFYEAIADFANKHLKPGGTLYFEINAALGKETVKMLHDKGFEAIRLKLDMQGKDRMISAQKPI
ncbi:peptide chain release factor N(5)-glutamine methyltransferase [Nubsella zeaxanthinifaciens]|uniref:peptide chain release factor N(5)-glutamine methyltransferase n=1 Tax=Nubsella zeaxanthinifaciens TaxID=392412 RepID=UPI000DE39764|nr:peptide chain release factor N(5)-glutamine methyltransferase [Nubsella zeaxanthinifaciens]